MESDSYVMSRGGMSAFTESNTFSPLLYVFFYDVITTFSLYASTGTYFHFKLLKLLVRIEAIKMTKTGRFKAHLQSQASKKMCHIQTLGTCHQIE